MTQTPQEILQERLKGVRAKFIDLLDERMDELEILRTQIDLQERRLEALQQTQFIAHKLRGTASTLGFDEIGRLAAETEDTIILHLSDQCPCPSLDDTKKIIDTFLESTAAISSDVFWKSA